MPKILTDFFPLAGGLDLLTPAIELPPGKCAAAQNYEPAIAGGYRRITGYERYDGQASPTAASFWYMTATITGTVTVGATLTGNTSGATGIVLGTATGAVILGSVSGTFVSGEALKISGVTVATATSASVVNGAPTQSTYADYALLAANAQRSNIGAVPGSGPIRGVWIYNDVVYAFRDNVGATAGTMWKAASTGWQQISLGREIQVTAPSATVTITIATPGVVTWNNHGLAANAAISFSTTGALPTGITAGTTYYVISTGLTANAFQFSTSIGGSAVATSGSQSGTQTCTAAPAQINDGDTITGVTSGATAVVTRAALRAGTWTANNLVATLTMATVTGTFQSGETLKVGGNAKVGTTTVDTAITLLPGGRFEFCNYNFTGSTSTLRMYGCDGVNKAFEFDGTVFVPIRTGMTTDTPQHLIGHKTYLFLSFNGSVQFSALGNPYSWTPILGAGEIATGDQVTGFLTQGGTDATGTALSIFTKNRTHMLYGTTASDFRLVTSAYEMGYSAYTMQQVSNNAFGLTARGIQSLISTLQFGDFDYASVSHFIQPLITQKSGLEIASVTSRAKNQYRVYFSDGTGLVVGLTGDQVSGIMPLSYANVVRCACSATLSTGAEMILFGSDNGYVYQEAGTSFDGATIEAFIRLAFNHTKSPRVRKRYRRAVLELTVEQFSQVYIGYDVGYGSPNVGQAPNVNTSLTGIGGYWDSFTWDAFNWDAQLVSDPTVSLSGAEKNIALLFYSNRAQDQSHTLQGVSLMYTPQRLER